MKRNILLFLFLSLFVFFSFIYYSKCYIVNDLCFLLTTEGSIYVLFGIGIIVVILIGFVNILLNCKIRREFNEFKEDVFDLILDIEDNEINFQKSTQLLIIKILDRLGVERDEKGN